MGRNLISLLVAGATAVLGLAGCGTESSVRTVQVDYKHDDFAAAFNAYFPKKLSVHPGDKVRFVNSWSGEPHTVTLGRVVDDIFEYTPIFEQYESEEAARAGGVTEAQIREINAAFARIPSLTTNNYKVYQPGAKPCFIARMQDVPAYSDENDEPSKDPSVNCSSGNAKQPAFTGRQALYNSGLIPFNGANADEFTVQIAEDATPGTYNYFCTFHWMGMSGELTIAKPSTKIPSSAEVIRTARREIRKMEQPLAAKVDKVAKGDFGDLTPPVAGLPPAGDDYAWVNEFYPRTLEAKVGTPVTWSVLGAAHTISFNVPSYFPVFQATKNGTIVNDDRVDKPVGWKVPEPGEFDEEYPPPRKVDVGEWNGSKAFRSSGILFDGDTFTMTFTAPGTYPYACLLHPPMIGTVEVSA